MSSAIARFIASAVYLLLLCGPCAVYAEWAKIITPYTQYNFYEVTWTTSGDVFAAGQNAAGGVVIKSSDYGMTWATVKSSTGGFFALNSKTIGTGTTYYIAVDTKFFVHVSSGTGVTWVTNAAKTSNSAYGVTIGSNGNAFISGTNFIRRATDSSTYTTWTTLTSGATGTAIWYDVSTVDGLNVIMVGYLGRAHYSSDGTAWTAGVSGTTGIIYCVAHVSTMVAMAAGELGYLAKTTDGGATWTAMTAFDSSFTARFHSISVLSSTDAYVAAFPDGGATALGVIYYTTNGGTTWSLLATTDIQLYSLSMYSSVHGVAGASSGVGLFALVSGSFRPTSLHSML